METRKVANRKQATTKCTPTNASNPPSKVGKSQNSKLDQLFGASSQGDSFGNGRNFFATLSGTPTDGEPSQHISKEDFKTQGLDLQATPLLQKEINLIVRDIRSNSKDSLEEEDEEEGFLSFK